MPKNADIRNPQTPALICALQDNRATIYAASWTFFRSKGGFNQ